MPVGPLTTDTPSTAPGYADVLADNRAPPLSASSDMPALDPANSVTADQDAARESEAVDAEAKPDNTDGTSGESEGEADGAPKETAGEGDATPPWIKARVTAESNKRRAAEQEATTLKAQLAAALKAVEKLTGEPEAPKEDPRPKRETFDDPDAYDKALEGWAGRRAAEVARTEAKADQARHEQARQTQSVIETYKSRQAEFEADHPDFEEVVFGDGLFTNPVLGQAILEAEDGPAIAYYLGQNPEVEQRISKLTPVQVVYEVGKISSKLSAPPPKPKPAPIRPLAARQTVEASLEEMSMEEYATKYSPNRRQAKAN
jgi:hypothetical protein